ncbi:type-2 ice-structuring protein-like [Pundamilia nyererei]|uniref:Type-2 ice-structuring protein-like n=1 Tax=Pundamilia nyererei TaxID=303518 RepID=A0A9Y3SBJ5_9CICH|nr:PREDICTED: type-2 ice-structuring protein-like [Pundamilia nyererei]
MKLLVVAALLCGSVFLTTAYVSGGAGGLIPTAKSYRFNMSSGCPYGWSHFNQRCFVYIPRSMSWAQAERNCLSMGAHLASVHSSSEYHHILKLTGDHGYKETWIGGTDASEENVWLWSDGTPFHYTHWCPGEPNNTDKQDCLQMNYGDSKCWDDMQCYANRPSVCAKKISKHQG